MNRMKYQILGIALLFCLVMGCASAGRQAAQNYGGGYEEAEESSSSVFDALSPLGSLL